MEGDMDFDASRVLSGEMSMEAATIALLEKIVHIAKGEASKSERLGHREYFVMYKHQSTTTLVDGCRQ